MTLEYLVKEYNELNSYKINSKSISKKILDFFKTLNVDPILFKEGDNIGTPWNFPESCKKDFIDLIEYLEIGNIEIDNIRRHDLDKIDLNFLDFCINTVIKALKALGYSEDKIHKVNMEILEFTEYSFIRAKKSTQDLLDDIDYMYNNDDDNLSLSEHILFQNYAETQIRKLQEQLQFIYYSMNTQKGMKNIQKTSRMIKQADKNGTLKDYLKKRMQVNNKLAEEFGKFEVLKPENKKILERRTKGIEIELFNGELQKHPYSKYLSESFELQKAIDQDEEYQSILQDEQDIINKKMTIKSKIKNVRDKELEMQKRKQQLSNELFGYVLTSPIEEQKEDEPENSYQLLEEGVSSAHMLITAKRMYEEDEWPFMISQCKDFFDQTSVK